MTLKKTKKKNYSLGSEESDIKDKTKKVLVRTVKKVILKKKKKVVGAVKKVDLLKHS